MTGVRRRRLLSLLGTGAAAVLGGCSGLFTRPDPDDATPAAPTATATGTPTPTAAPTATPARDATVVAVPSYDLSLRYRPSGDVTTADVRFELRNVGERTIRLVDLRVDLVYRPRTVNRTVAVDYVGRRFGDGFAAGATTTVEYGTRYPNDGRADGSSDPDDFAAVFLIRGIEFG